MVYFFFFQQKTAYEMRISDWSSDVCSSDLGVVGRVGKQVGLAQVARVRAAHAVDHRGIGLQAHAQLEPAHEHAGDLRPLVRDAGFLLDDRDRKSTSLNSSN